MRVPRSSGWFYAVLLGVVGMTALPGRADERELARYDLTLQPKDRTHWAFQPVQRPTIPVVKDAAWVRNPIDAFILARLEARGYAPSPAAQPHELLRRYYLNVIGLPPTLAEQEAFLRAPSPQALDRVLDDLLARPSYGERWGRHWLDWVRFAETNGYERDAAKPFAWRYRDYVIRAFNADKPYARFVLEQLAGDELPDTSAETLIATGYYRLGPWDDEPADPAEDRFDQLDDLVATTSQVFLGLTLACARCHNHKFEPFSQLDYYRMTAIFSPLQRPQRGRTELSLPAGTPAELAAWQQHLRSVTAEVGAVLSPRPSPLLTVSTLQRVQALPALTAPVQGYFLHETSAKSPATHVLIRGKAARPGPEVPPGMPKVLLSEPPTFLSPDANTSRRRLTLAQWIARPENTLTARVLVNRVWQQHFGEGLVRTPSDFGTHGARPTHPELLDWLADWFVHEGGWSLKKLHRLILTSNAARMSKRWQPEYGAADPENRLLWRVPYRRLEVEAIRDSMLAVSGQLNPKMFGPSMYPHVPKEALEGHSDPDKIWKPLNEAEASRRTIYAFVKRSLVVPLLEVLDLCDTTRSTARRQITTVAPQALSLFNGDFVNRQARHLATRLMTEVGDDPARQVERAYRLALCRPPTASERGTLVQFLERETANQTSTRGALEQMCRVVLNLNEFVYPD